MNIEDRLEEIQEKCQGRSGSELEEARRVSSEHIREIRKELGLSIVEFARKVGVPSITVKRWESGEYSPNSLTTRQLKKNILKDGDDFAHKPKSVFRIEIGVSVDNLDDAVNLLMQLSTSIKGHAGNPIILRATLK
jgi:DNA-binding transcriptional regulator YiaG